MAFNGTTFCLTGTFSVPRKDLEQGIKGYGGATASSVTAKVDILIATQPEVDKPTKKVEAANKKGVPVVGEDFLDACKNAGSLVDEQQYLLVAGGGGKAKKAPAKKAPAKKAPAKKAPAKKATAASKKRAAPAPAPAPAAKKAAYSVMQGAPSYLSSAKVVGDYTYTLNQTNIGNNNNKFYLGQIVTQGGQYFHLNRWGRVGETGQNNWSKDFSASKDQPAAISEFEKKFKSKTANNWDDRDNFVMKKGKYGLVETETDQEIAAKQTAAVSSAATAPTAPSKLDKPTKDLVSWIMDKDMIIDQMSSFEIDVKKCPLGAITKAQVDKGFAVLESIDKLLQGGKVGGKKVSAAKKMDNLQDLSSDFYTIIPHAFGRSLPPVIDNDEKLQQKFDLVQMLGDIEITQSMGDDAMDEDGDVQQHPIDRQYEVLGAELGHVKKSAEEYKIVQKYITATKQHFGVKLVDLWSINREGEAKRFKAHNKLKNRRLLWHGTNIANVAAIMKTGLRIFPTASTGSRVGRGIYLASENGKSAGYTRTDRRGSKHYGIMFLCEAPMGKAKEITVDDWTLTAPPKGFDSVIAKGNTEPDPSKDIEIEIDGKPVIVAQGNPISTGANSNFSQSEYLVYKESQCRIRYVVKVEIDNGY